jgi:hypothetical protein
VLVDAVIALLFLLTIGTVLSLGIAAIAMHGRDYRLAERWATGAGVGSWILMGFEALLVGMAVNEGWIRFAADPIVAAALACPPAAWFFARTIRRSAKRRREEVVAARTLREGERAARKSLREEARERAQGEERRKAEEPPAAGDSTRGNAVP